MQKKKKTSYEHVYKVTKYISRADDILWSFYKSFFFLVIKYIKTTFLQVIKRFLI